MLEGEQSQVREARHRHVLPDVLPGVDPEDPACLVRVVGVGGLGTWLIAPSHTVHIGASGVVFGYAAYLVARGIYSRSLGQIAIGLVVLAIWGTTLLQGLVPEDGISWQGHLFGALGGILAARVLHRRAVRAGTESPAALTPS